MITPAEATELLDIINAAERGVREAFCWDDLDSEGVNSLNRSSYRIYRWRQRLEHIVHSTPAPAADSP